MSDPLTLTQDIEYVKYKFQAVSDTLTLTQSIAVQHISTVLMNHNLN